MPLTRACLRRSWTEASRQACARGADIPVCRRASADFHLAVGGDRLALLVEGHDDGGGAVAADQAGLFEELRLALLEADRVDDALALHALQARLDHLPLRAVDHHRDVVDRRLG